MTKKSQLMGTNKVDKNIFLYKCNKLVCSILIMNGKYQQCGCHRNISIFQNRTYAYIISLVGIWCKAFLN